MNNPVDSAVPFNGSRREPSIQRKLTLIVLVTIAGACALAGVALYLYERSAFRAALSRELQTLAQVSADTSTAAVAFDDARAANQVLAALRAVPQIEAAAIYLPDGRVFTTFQRDDSRDLIPAEPGAFGYHTGDDNLSLFAPIRDEAGDETIGTIFLRADFLILRERLRLYAWVIAGIFLACVAVVFVLSIRLLRFISDPIMALARVARIVSKDGDYRVRAQGAGRDEIGVLTLAFNRMLDRIEEQDTALRTANEELERRVDERTMELQRLKYQMESILNSAGEGIFGLDLRGRLTFVNPIAAAACGWEVESLAGQHEHEILVHERDGRAYPQEDCPLCRQLDDARVHYLPDVMIRRRNGETFHAEYTRTPIIEGGVQAGAVVVFRDTTERRELESQLLHSQKLESVGQLAGGVAHDFNNLISVIQGYAELLLQRQSLPPSAIDPLRHMRNAAEKAAALTRQLLMFSRRHILERRNVDLNGIVDEMAKMLQRILEEHITTVIHTADSLPSIYADTGMIEQVLMNLAINARDAMPEGGRLEIRTEVRELDVTQCASHPDARPGCHVVLTVADAGCGIPEEVLPRIFEPFFTTKDEGKGTGLGLATVYGIVRQHDGWITVKSAAGSGTTFEIFFPGGRKPADAVGAVQGAALVGGSETILIVEDDPGLRTLQGQILREAGYRVIEAETGIQAYRHWKARDAEIDLLITDRVLPGEMSGQELAERLVAERPGLKVMSTSGYLAVAPERKKVFSDDQGFLRKPFTPEELCQAVRRRLDCSDGEAE